MNTAAARNQASDARPAPGQTPAPATQGSPVALEVRDLSVTFGAVVANNRIDMACAPGVVAGVMGPNGAGKSTLLDAVGGYLPATGVVRLAGEDISGLPPHLRARRGLGRTFQGAQLFGDLTVAENVRVGARGAGTSHRVRPDSGGSTTDVASVLDDLGVVHLADALPQQLSTGQRRLVALARALAGRPRVLLMDEPAAGLSQPERRALGETVLRLADTGVAVVLIDHDVDLVLRVSTHVYVLAVGRILAEGPPAEVRGDERVRQAYLGDLPGSGDA